MIQRHRQLYAYGLMLETLAKCEKSGAEILLEINGVPTLGRARDELMPLLKLRPLELRILPENSQ